MTYSPHSTRREDARRRRQAERARGRFAGPFVFLDFDGVLNHTDWFKTRRERRKPDDWRWDDLSFDRVCVERLNRLLAQTAARVVVSSSWRYGDVRGERVVCKTPQWLESLLRRHGFNGIVLDVTPILGGMRGGEIRAWLDARAEPGAAFVILDDEDYAQLDWRLVQTDFAAGGLLDVHVDRAITMLGGLASVADVVATAPVRPDGVSEEAVRSATRAADGVVGALIQQRYGRSPDESMVGGAIVRPAACPPDSLADVLAAKQCGDCGKGVVEAYGYHPKGLGTYVVCEAGCGWWLGAQDPDMKEPAPLTPEEREATLAEYQARRNARKRSV
jgi:hypothetical protein